MPNPTKTNSEQVEEWEEEFENYFSNGYIQRISAIEFKKQCKMVIKDILAHQQSELLERVQAKAFKLERYYSNPKKKDMVYFDEILQSLDSLIDKK